MRFAIFKANLARVNAHNAREETYTMAMNEFGDLTPREFGMARIGGAKVPKLRGQRGQRPEEIPVVVRPFLACFVCASPVWVCGSFAPRARLWYAPCVCVVVCVTVCVSVYRLPFDEIVCVAGG